ncbi:MAG: hypothetical protein OXU24_08080 [Gammaproteobacteria bacterium]|nr:hypothetical protein [Gammaproteobacteria bacterium]
MPISQARKLLLASVIVLTGCASEFVVSVNEQAIYDPQGRLITGEVDDADLQGCINLAMQQQQVASAAELTVLSCANSEISNLENIDQLLSLRFLDLGNNNISNITPLEELPLLSGINLLNNRLTDIGPLFNMPNLSSVNLIGNNSIDCDELAALQARLGSKLTSPESCDN